MRYLYIKYGRFLNKFCTQTLGGGGGGGWRIYPGCQIATFLVILPERLTVLDGLGYLFWYTQ